jgi:endonuclease G
MIKHTLTVLTAALSFTAFAQTSSCPQLYPNSVPIVIPNTVELCSTFYVSRYDTTKKAAILVSERLVAHSPVGALSRINAFSPDSRIKNGPQLRDYTNSGYDRGHLAPSDDASTAQEMKETFLLTNMTPQDQTLNRTSWALLERHVRTYAAKQSVNTYVINVPIYPKTNLKMIGSGIPVPNGYWKFTVTSSETRKYYADNTAIAKVTEYPGTDMLQIINQLNK